MMNEGSHSSRRWMSALDRALLLTWRKGLIALGVFAGSAVLHKGIDLLLYGRVAWASAAELSLVILGTGLIPLYFLVSLMYTVVRRLSYRQYLLLTWKTLLALACAEVVSIFLHAALYAAFYDYFRRQGGDEAVFFLLALFVIPLYFLVCVGYTVYAGVRGIITLIRTSVSKMREEKLSFGALVRQAPWDEYLLLERHRVLNVLTGWVVATLVHTALWGVFRDNMYPFVLSLRPLAFQVNPSSKEFVFPIMAGIAILLLGAILLIPLYLLVSLGYSLTGGRLAEKGDLGNNP